MVQQSELGNWKDIEGYANYMGSDRGYVMNKKTKKLLSGAMGTAGYHRVNLYENGVKNTLYIHKLVAKAFVVNADSNDFVDHIDGDKVNNKADNLRWCTQSENNRNMPKRNASTTSTFKGVCWHSGRNKWIAYITFDCVRKHLGYFDSEVQAAVAYNNAAIEYFAEFAALSVIPLDSFSSA